MYESFLPDFNGGPAFYARLGSEDLSALIKSNAEQYFSNNNIEYTVDDRDDEIRFSTSAGLFVVDFRNDAPSAIRIYSMGGDKVKNFRDSIWVSKKAFGFPVMAVMDDACDGYFETHPSKFNVILFPKSFGF